MLSYKLILLIVGTLLIFLYVLASSVPYLFTHPVFNLTLSYNHLHFLLKFLGSFAFFTNRCE